MSEKKENKTPMSVLLASDRIVQVYVGKERKLWIIHEDLLCERIPFFKAAFKGGFKEAHEKSIELVGDSVAAFAQVVAWTYWGILDCACSNQEAIGDKKVVTVMTPEQEMLWCSVWVLTDKFQLEILAEKAIKRFRLCLFHGRSSDTICAATIDYVYNNTMEASPLRKLLVTEFARRYFRPQKTHETSSKIIADMASNELFGIHVLDAIEKHTKEESCKWGKACFRHEVENMAGERSTE